MAQTKSPLFSSNSTKSFHNVAFSGDFNDLTNRPPSVEPYPGWTSMNESTFDSQWLAPRGGTYGWSKDQDRFLYLTKGDIAIGAHGDPDSTNNDTDTILTAPLDTQVFQDVGETWNEVRTTPSEFISYWQFYKYPNFSDGDQITFKISDAQTNSVYVQYRGKDLENTTWTPTDWITVNPDGNDTFTLDSISSEWFYINVRIYGCPDGTTLSNLTFPGVSVEEGIQTLQVVDKAIINQALIGTDLGTHAIFKHKDMTSSSDYCILQTSEGATFVNAKAGQNITIRNGNSGNHVTFNPSGAVGIGTTNPSGKLDVVGTLNVSGTKNFRMPHPVRQGHDLVHSCIETNRVDLLYRGVAQGGETLDLDLYLGMTQGTLGTLTRDPWIMTSPDVDVDLSNYPVVTFGETPRPVRWLLMAERADVSIDLEPQSNI